MDIDFFAGTWGFTREETIALIDEAIKCKSFFLCFTYDYSLDKQFTGGKFVLGIKIAYKYLTSLPFNQQVKFRIFQYLTWHQIDFRGSSTVGFIHKILRRINWLFAERIRRSLLMSTGVDLSPFALIEKGFWVGEMFNIHMTALSRVGKNVRFGVRVNLVAKPSKKPFTAPEIKDGATIWTGAVIVGVKVGENATVGANSVVIRDVPTGATVIGNPAEIVYIKPSSSIH